MFEIPTEVPGALRSACKCVPIDPDWPISGPLHAMELMRDWDIKEDKRTDWGQSQYERAITHSHAGEFEDLQRLGPTRVYKESIYTKFVSIGWHLAGRYEYDVDFIRLLTEMNWLSPRGEQLTMIDFGAAPWIQSIFYANKGLDVIAVNADLESDCNRFGRFLAERNGYERIPGKPEYKITDTWFKGSNGLAHDNERWITEESSFEEGWKDYSYDIVYAIDVLEHIPPQADGSPGWVPVADKLYEQLSPGGIWYVNAPLTYDTTVHPVPTHPVHFTSPISHEAWATAKGLIPTSYSCVWRKL